MCEIRFWFANVRVSHISIDTLLAKPVNWHVKCHVPPDTCLPHATWRCIASCAACPFWSHKTVAYILGLWRNLLHDITDNAKYFQWALPATAPSESESEREKEWQKERGREGAESWVCKREGQPTLSACSALPKEVAAFGSMSPCRCGVLSLSLFPSFAISFYHPLCVALIDVEGFAKIFNNMPSQTFILASKDLAQKPLYFYRCCCCCCWRNKYGGH